MQQVLVRSYRSGKSYKNSYRAAVVDPGLGKADGKLNSAGTVKVLYASPIAPMKSRNLKKYHIEATKEAIEYAVNAGLEIVGDVNEEVMSKLLEPNYIKITPPQKLAPLALEWKLDKATGR